MLDMFVYLTDMLLNQFLNFDLISSKEHHGILFNFNAGSLRNTLWKVFE